MSPILDHSPGSPPTNLPAANDGDLVDHSTKPITHNALAVPADVYERQRATISEPVSIPSLLGPPLKHHAFDFRPPRSRGHDSRGPVAASVMLVLVP
jgi:hypothetical protein